MKQDDERYLKKKDEKPTKKRNTNRAKSETSKGKIRYITKWRETGFAMVGACKKHLTMTNALPTGATAPVGNGIGNEMTDHRGRRAMKVEMRARLTRAIVLEYGGYIP